MSVRIGFIGAGAMAGSHLETLVPMPDVEVVALCDISSDQIDATQESVNRRLKESTYGGVGRQLDAVAYTDYGSMLRNEQLDAVYLCLPPFAHGAPEEAVIDAGLPMLVEKPVALELSLANRLLGAIRHREIMVATGYQTRFAAHIEQMREALAGQTVGMALVMRFGRSPATSWYHRQEKSGGQMIEMATHQVDLLRYLVGEIRTVYAAAATRINHRTRPDYDIFDVNCATLAFDNGAVANFANNFISPHGVPTDAQGLHIFCGDVTLSLSKTARIISSTGTTELEVEQDPLAKSNRAFVEAVASRRADRIKSDYQNGVRNLAVTIAADRSARTGRPIDMHRLLADEAPHVSADA